MDAEIVKAVNGMAGQWPILDEIMKALSSLGFYICILAVLVLFFKYWRAALSGVAGILLGLLINLAIIQFYQRPRPFVALDSIESLLEKTASASFPSDTVVVVFAAATALWLISRKLGSVFMVLAVLIAFSRLYVGHHYLTDVLVAAVIGVLMTAVSSLIFRGSYKRERTISLPRGTGKRTHFP